MTNSDSRGLRPAKAAEKLGVGLSTLWRYAKTIPDFPRAIKLSPRCTIFLESDIDAWLISKKDAEAKDA